METWVRSPGQEDPLEKGMATHSSILALRVPQTEDPRGLQSMGSQRVRHNQATNTHTCLFYSHRRRVVASLSTKIRKPYFVVITISL